MQTIPTSRVGRIADTIEETSIAICIGLMVLVTFANVVARYAFSDNILWANEITEFLFAWLVLMGMSYGVKKHVHIGVDVVIQHLSPAARKIAALLAVTACLAFALMVLYGSWHYWLPFATERAWMETDDTPMPEMFQFLAEWMNEGERYEKIPRWIPYLALPLGLALLTLRFFQQAWYILTGKVDMIIASHEAEELIEELEMADPHPQPLTARKDGEG
ncbi:TRAP transporter small permease [Thiosocius teredinicola]|uniref:TRAP transporter small permease n=1 Tax=Thiosocius teredinicola TaxID=1973002 RepID=UPI000990EFA5